MSSSPPSNRQNLWSCGWVLPKECRFKQEEHYSQVDFSPHIPSSTSSLLGRQQYSLFRVISITSGSSFAQTLPQSVSSDSDHNKITSLRSLPRATFPLLA